MNARHSRLALLALGLSSPLLAQAHPGHELSASFLGGALHPLSGIDHLLAMLAMGAWAAQLGGRMRWAMPLCFVASMIAGAVLGFAGVTMGAIEQGIAASLLVLGIFVAVSVRLPTLFSLALAASFAVFHGYAHAVESAVGATSIYIGGFVLSSLALQFAGFAATRKLIRSQHQIAVRWGGALVATCGAALLMAG